MERRGREPLYKENFKNHFFGESSFEETFMYGNIDKGYILGITKAGIFIPSHFAPRTMRGGYELIKELGKGEFPCVMAITPDLVDTVKKIPEWHEYDFSFISNFRYEEVVKQVVYNDYPGIEEMIPKLVEEYINESSHRYNSDDNDLSEPPSWDDEFEEAA